LSGKKLFKTQKTPDSMANEEKLSGADLAMLAVIVLILLFFPYKMMSEHQQDATAMSYYHNGR
jgi:hypothetical protein